MSGILVKSKGMVRRREPSKFVQPSDAMFTLQPDDKKLAFNTIAQYNKGVFEKGKNMQHAHRYRSGSNQHHYGIGKHTRHGMGAQSIGLYVAITIVIIIVVVVAIVMTSKTTAQGGSAIAVQHPLRSIVYKRSDGTKRFLGTK
jgi:hypothetical protein